MWRIFPDADGNYPTAIADFDDFGAPKKPLESNLPISQFHSGLDISLLPVSPAKRLEVIMLSHYASQA